MDEIRRPRGGPLHALQGFTVEAERYLEVTRRLSGLGHNDVHALNVVVEAEDLGHVATPGTLRRRLVLSPAATTALVDRLVGHGLLRRQKASADGRTVELHPTAEARLMGRNMFAILSAEMMARLAVYTPGEMKLFMTMIEDMTEAAKRARERLEAGEVAADLGVDSSTESST